MIGGGAHGMAEEAKSSPRNPNHSLLEVEERTNAERANGHLKEKLETGGSGRPVFLQEQETGRGDPSSLDRSLHGFFAKETGGKEERGFFSRRGR